MTIIKNDFHNTEYNTPKTCGEVRYIFFIQPECRTQAQKAWVSRVRRKLCGSKMCTCGGELGERGMQEFFYKD